MSARLIVSLIGVETRRNATRKTTTGGSCKRLIKKYPLLWPEAADFCTSLVSAWPRPNDRVSRCAQQAAINTYGFGILSVQLSQLDRCLLPAGKQLARARFFQANLQSSRVQSNVYRLPRVGQLVDFAFYQDCCLLSFNKRCVIVIVTISVVSFAPDTKTLPSTTGCSPLGWP